MKSIKAENKQVHQASPPKIEESEREKIRIVVPAGKRPERIDVFLTHSVENATRSKVQHAIEEQSVLVNHKPTKSSYKVAPLDIIDITLPHPPPPDVVAEDIPIEIVYEDQWLIIINKPAGMVVHPAYANWSGTLVNALLHHIEQLSDFHTDPIRPGIVHRIDKDTSGLLVIAKYADIHAKLSKDFARHAIDREYFAICVGKFKEQKGTIRTFITRDKRDRKKFMTHDTEGKSAVTHYQVLGSFGHYHLISCKLETGRTHQIRVHLSSIGCPILGDATYGGTVNHSHIQTPKDKQFFAKLLTFMPRQALHAKTLGFFHPGKKEQITFESDLPLDFKRTLEELTRTHSTF